MQTLNTAALPDPQMHADFYAGVPTKRLFAWLIDTLAIVALTAIVVLLSLFTTLLILPLVALVVNFAYRTVTLARNSATPGMRLMGITMLTREGKPFDLATAALHTLGYTISISTVLIQVVSIVLMLSTTRGQGLTDHLLGTIAINKPSQY